MLLYAYVLLNAGTLLFFRLKKLHLYEFYPSSGALRWWLRFFELGDMQLGGSPGRVGSYVHDGVFVKFGFVLGVRAYVSVLFVWVREYKKF
jgi:hypothetical protein